MIDPVTGWFEISQHDGKREIYTANLFETTWLFRCSRPMEVTYDQGYEFIGHKFRKSLIETEYEITSKTSTPGNQMSNTVLERIHQVLGNLVRTFNISLTYVEKKDPWTDILAVAAFVIFSKTNGQKGYSTSQLIFLCDMILPIKHKVDWEVISKQKETKINKDNIRKKIHRVEHDYKVGDNDKITKHTSKKYETPYTVPFVITQCFINVMVELQYGATKIRYNIHRIKPYKQDTKVEDINTENTDDGVNI